MILATLLACARAPEPGNPEFNDAIHQAFVGFDDPEVELAFALRELERMSGEARYGKMADELQAGGGR